MRRTILVISLLAAAASMAPPPGAAPNENPRWAFLTTNLGVFPGTEQLFEPDEKLFWKLRPNLRAVAASEKLPDVEYPFTVSTGPDGHRLTPKSGGKNETVLFLGDSCTFGIPVNDNETFPALVQREIEGIRVINAGVPGYSAFQGRLVLENWSGPAPAAVVITFWPNGRSSWDHLSDLEHQELLAAERQGEFSRHRLTRLLRRVSPGTRPRLNDEEFAAEIRKMIAWCREHGSRPILQVWPVQKQSLEAVEIDRQAQLRQIAAAENVPLVDLVPHVRKAADPALFADNIHMRQAGYKLVAKVLAPAVQSEWRRAQLKR
jgi:lysophospholipase L1-like esterase